MMKATARQWSSFVMDDALPHKDKTSKPTRIIDEGFLSIIVFPSALEIRRQRKGICFFEACLRPRERAKFDSLQ